MLPATTVIAPPNPVITFATPDMLVTGVFATYQWYFNGAAIPGANSSVYHYTLGGEYTVVVTDTNSCPDTSAPYIVTGNTGNGITTTYAGDNVSIYPNPATSVLNIDAPVKVNVAIVSMDGKVLMTAHDAKAINIVNLTSGLYMIRIYDQNDQLLKTSKFAITRQ
jgi:hypothetical protein